MAYNKGYNPDALPAHVEPEQAAAILHRQPQKPQPPLPPQQQQQQQQSPYATRPPPQQPSPYNQQQQHNYGHPPLPGGAGRAHSPRYDSRPPQLPTDNRYSSGSGSGRNDYPGSPPPQTYGYGSLGPPPQQHSRPPNQSRPPPTPAPPPRDGNDREALWPLFKAVDKDGSGHLCESELRAALVNGDWTRFDPHTVRMMIRMFDTDRSGSINFDEFCGLWGFLAAWRNLFDRFDADRSGSIQYTEFKEALIAFGYRLSPQFVTLLFKTYDRRGDNAMSFDLFVQACISLKRMTDVFKKYDDDRDGYITLSFEEFLSEILSQMD